MSPLIHYKMRVALVCGTAVLGAGLAPAAAAAMPTESATDPSFCVRQQILRDYLAPVSHLSKAPGFLESGRLRVGPPALRIYPPAENVVAIGKGRFEVWASVGGNHKSQALDWWVISRLQRINRRGERVGVAKEKKQHVPTVGAFERRDFGFGGRVPAGFYRLTIAIENARGASLTRYQEFFRALPVRSQLRVSSNFTTLARGESGDVRVDNLGTVPAAYGVGYRLFNAQGEEVPVEAVFPDVLLRLPAGDAGSCISFTAPTQLLPGEYRIQVEAVDFRRKLLPLDTSVIIR